MPGVEQELLERMALSAQLARQFCHDCRNFLYNLTLQIEMGETLPNPQRSGWDSVKQEAKKLAGRMQEWESFLNHSVAEETSAADLNQVVREISRTWSAREVSIELAPSILTEPLLFTGIALNAVHLLCLLLEDALTAWQEPNTARLAISIQTERSKRKAIVRILEVSAEKVWPGRDRFIEARPTTLIEATCQSLAQRLDATIHRETRADGKAAILVEFPLSHSGASS